MSKPWLSGCLLAVAVAGCRTTPPEDSAALPGKDQYVVAAKAYQEGDRAKAVASLKEAIQENPNFIMARFLLGNIYKDQSEFIPALEQYRKVAELDPYVALNHYNVGLVNHLLDRLREAADSYEQALRIDPSDAKANMNLGLAYTMLGRTEEAVKYSTKATQVNPTSAEAWTNLGVVLDANRDLIGAEAAYQHAMELDTDRLETAENLAANLNAQRKPTEAIAVYERLLPRHDSSSMRQRYGQSLLLAGRFDDAAAAFNQALKMDLRNYTALNGLGDTMLALYKKSATLDEDKRKQAVAYWKKSLVMNPNQDRVKGQIKEYEQTQMFGPAE